MSSVSQPVSDTFVGNSATGYKSTDIGMIPEDWDVYSLQDIVNQFVNGGTPSTKNEDFWSGNIPWITGADILEQEVAVIRRHITTEAVDSSSTNVIPKGSLLIVSRTGVGKLAIAPCDIAISQDFTGIILRKEKILAEYLFRYLDFFQDALIRQNQGTSIKGITRDTLAAILIAVPSSAEQRAIAEALSDVDGSIKSLEALVAKKKAIKRTTMQQLLTGKIRLPGFSVKRTELNMARDSILKARIGWQGLTTAEYLTTGNYYLVTGTDFLNGRVDWSTCHFIDRSRFVQDINIQLAPDDVLLTKDGTIGKAGFIDSLPGPATLNSGVFVIRPKKKSYFPKYMYYILTSHIFSSFLERLQAGSTIVHLYQKDFSNFSFNAPPIDEQVAIVTALSDLDAEIASLEQRLNKTDAIKQGMMQQLLTGKVRLFKPE